MHEPTVHTLTGQADNLRNTLRQLLAEHPELEHLQIRLRGAHYTIEIGELAPVCSGVDW